MPFSRSWATVLLMMFFFMPMWYFEITLLQITVVTWGNSADFFILTFALFNTFVLILWSFFTFIITGVVLTMIWGRNVLLIYNGIVETHLGIPWVTFAIREAAADINNVLLVDANPNTFFAQKGKQLKIRSKHFKKKSKKRSGNSFHSVIGSNMTEQDVLEVKQAIEPNRLIETKLNHNAFSQKRALQQKPNHAVTSTLTGLDDSDSDLKLRTTRTVSVLILANLLPIFGVLALDWNLREIMVLYWVETAVILFYHLLKNILISPSAGLFLGIATLCVIGAGMAMHLLFIWFILSALTGDEYSSAISTAEVGQYISSLWFGILALTISHGYSFVTHFLPSSQRHSQKLLGIDRILSRIRTMSLTIIFGMFFALVIGEPVWSLFVLVMLKLTADINTHIKQHNKRV